MRALRSEHGNLKSLHHTFFQQLKHCQYEITPGPEKKIKWSVPDGTRDLESGESVHDDLVICAALLSVLDEKSWSISGAAAIVECAAIH